MRKYILMKISGTTNPAVHLCVCLYCVYSANYCTSSSYFRWLAQTGCRHGRRNNRHHYTTHRHIHDVSTGCLSDRIRWHIGWPFVVIPILSSRSPLVNRTQIASSDCVIERRISGRQQSWIATSSSSSWETARTAASCSRRRSRRTRKSPSKSGCTYCF